MKGIHCLSVVVLTVLVLGIIGCGSGEGGEDCAAPCLGVQCGDVGGCHCGSCGEGFVCEFNVCMPEGPVDCTLACIGIQCGVVAGCPCGTCGENQVCQDYMCKPTDPVDCVAACTGRECGTVQGCDCGQCAPGTACNLQGKCESCQADCANKECGDDGCGGDCGQCAPGTACNPQGICEACQSDCTNKECGDDGCGGSCGTCNPDMTCNAQGQCEACQPDCTNKDCGDDGCGGDCGLCPIGQKCTGNTCVPSVGPGSLGTYCGATAECPSTIPDPDTGEPMSNPQYLECINAQCDSNACLNGSLLGVLLNVPACTTPCQIYFDDVNNKTLATGPDGIEDPDPVLTDCYGFADGPGGDQWVCVDFAPLGSGNPNAFCAPGTTFHFCDSDADCVEGEQCAFTTIGGEFAERCITRIQATAEVSTAKMSENCDEGGTLGPVTFCESGWCFGLGCVSYCSDDVHCDTTKLFPDTGCDTASGTCKGWSAQSCTQDSDCSHWECGYLDATIFSDMPEYTVDLCWPKTGCQGDGECPDGYYCLRNWDGDWDPQTGLPFWSNFCVDQFEGGVGLGGECSDWGPTCKNDSLCVGGHCSALCDADADCGNNQLCTVNEFQVDLDDDGQNDQSLPLEWCTTHEGSLTPCFSDATCGDSEHCDIFEIESAGNDPDGPYLAKGLCVTVDPSLSGYVESCIYGSDCATGWCLNSDPDSGSSGFCSSLCETAEDCPDVESGGTSFQGLCSGLLWSWGGDSSIVEYNIHLGICFFTTGSATDCSATLACGPGETCIAFPISFGPDYPAHVDYRCLSAENPDGSMPDLVVGEACDPWAEDMEGNPVDQCLSGYCLEDGGPGTGYCSELCKPGSVDCTHPAHQCFEETTIPRKGKYQGNSGTYYLCQPDSECTPCFHSGTCPGDRVCVNLGQNDDTLADYRCVEACNGDGDCIGAGSSNCNLGYDGYGQSLWGCFDQGASFPINHCK